MGVPLEPGRGASGVEKNGGLAGFDRTASIRQRHAPAGGIEGASAGKRHGHPHVTGSARTCGCVDDTDLYPCDEETGAGGEVRDTPPLWSIT